MNEKAELFVHLLKKYAKQVQSCVRSTSDTSPLEQWLGNRINRLINGRRIICAAIFYNDEKPRQYLPHNIEEGIVVCGRRHPNCLAQLDEMGFEMKSKYMTQGFLTSDNHFLDRQEAAKLAYEAGQITEKITTLFSEDLY